MPMKSLTDTFRLDMYKFPYHVCLSFGLPKAGKVLNQSVYSGRLLRIRTETLTAGHTYYILG